jgi:hypothetical protein
VIDLSLQLGEPWHEVKLARLLACVVGVPAEKMLVCGAFIGHQ